MFNSTSRRFSSHTGLLKTDHVSEASAFSGHKGDHDGTAEPVRLHPSERCGDCRGQLHPGSSLPGVRTRFCVRPLSGTRPISHRAGGAVATSDRQDLVLQDLSTSPPAEQGDTRMRNHEDALTRKQRRSEHLEPEQSSRWHHTREAGYASPVRPIVPLWQRRSGGQLAFHRKEACQCSTLHP